MNITPPASTSTPASEISRESFERDDSVNSAELEAKLLGDILRNSPVAGIIGIEPEESLPDEDEAAPTTDSSDEVDPDAEEQSENDPDEDDQESADDEDDEGEDDEDSTRNQDLPTEDDIDWEYKVPVSIDGKIEYKTLQELRKGYAVDQHLSQKGRELGELKKQIEAERETKLKEIVDIGSVLNQDLMAKETELATEYNSLEAKIKEAREIGDTYTARELKEKRDEIAERYWAIRNDRETKVQKVATEFKKQQEEQQKRLLEEFQKEIPKYVPDFNEKVATSIREFAIKEGIPEGLLSEVYSPAVVKFINDYRVLKMSVEKGSAKRKQAPASTKSVPTKKGTPASTAQKKANDTVRARALTGVASNREQLDFLKNISKVSQKL